MKKFYLLFFITLYSFSIYSQVYKCGVTVSNYLEHTQEDVNSICSDKNDNIYYLQGNAIYKNNVSWISLIPGTYTSYFSYPYLIATDQTNIYVYDDNYLLHKVTPDGTVTLVAGVKNIGTSLNGPMSTATFGSNVTAMCADQSGNIYLGCDYYIRKVDTNGNVTTLTGQTTSGNTNGDAATATFGLIQGLTSDNMGHLYVATSGTLGQYIRQVNSTGDVSNFAGGYMEAYIDDTNYKAGFDNLSSIYYGLDNYLYVGDNSKIRRISPTGETITLIGYPVSATDSYNLMYANGNYDQVNATTGITRTSNGDVYFVSTYTIYDNSIIQKISIDESCENEQRIVETICGDGYINANTPGNGRAAEFTYTTSIAMDNLGNLFITAENTTQVFKMTPNKDVSLFYTSPLYSTATPEGLVVDANGNVYVAIGNEIEVINSSGTYVKTFNNLYTDPFSANRMVFNSNGDLIFSDNQNHNIRKLNVSTGVYSTIAGESSGSSNYNSGAYIDGTALTARFFTPSGIVFDSKGNLYIADRDNYCIRKLDIQGNVTTVAGTGSSFGNSDGTGNSALFGEVVGLAIDSADNMYVTDVSANMIKKISAGNYTVTTIAGNSYAYKSLYIDGKSSIASFNNPCDLLIDRNSDLWLADQANSVVRRITGLNTTSNATAIANPIPTTNNQTPISYPNPTNNLLHFDQERSYELYNISEVLISSGENSFVDMSSLPTGFYLIRFTDINKTEKIIKN